MSTLYIDRQGTQLRTDSGVLHIETPDGVGNRRIPLKFLERVVLRADTQLSSRVLCALAENGSSLLALGGRGGEKIAQITGSPHGEASLASLRGLEGAAAAAYFAAYFSAFAPALGATTRNRRPPKDPVNAVLSLSYTLLYSQASSACWAAGLDPALGALHTLVHNRAALACDLMEPHRPRIDLWVWQLFRSETLRPEHFGHDGAGACLLGKAGRSHFYGAWEAIAKQQSRSLLRQARHLARTFDAQSQTHTWAHLMDDTPDTF